jgi:hypothetical protein
MHTHPPPDTHHPRFLYAAESNHTYVALLLETMNNIVQASRADQRSAPVSFMTSGPDLFPAP